MARVSTLMGGQVRQTAIRLAKSAGDGLKNGVAYLRQDSFLAFLLALTFVSGVFWAAIIPLWQAPDEPDHFGYVQNLGEKLSLFPETGVSQERVTVDRITGLVYVKFDKDVTQPFSAGSQKGPDEEAVKELPRNLRQDLFGNNPATSYPPGYYLPASLVYRLLKAHDILTIMFGLRIFSAFITTVTILFHYLTLKRFFSDQATAKATALLIALSPMYIYMGMAVNPDVLVWLVFSVYLYLLTKAMSEGLSPGLNLSLGVTAALGLWIKQTFLVAIPFYAILLVFLNLKKTVTPSRSVAPLLVFLGAVAVLDGWLYLGDFIRTSPSYPNGEYSEEASPLGYLRHLWNGWPLYRATFDSFWGNFGWLDTPLSQRSYTLVRWGCAAAAAALVAHLTVSAVRGRINLMSLFYLILSITFVALWTGVNYIRITTGESWLLQGRYFFPMIAPIMGLLVQGSTAFIDAKFRNAVLIALVVGMALFETDVLFRYVLPRYYL